ncbi:hypothetical protein AURANDRAFT_67302 [Aureococcus anophagefferens]|uniref:acetate--CoA ligase n=1 Tax=Aureococcus anophagefferens TaxID=44056 RepID=F0YKP8_AURAN|nr:hypothetical protein AURANDRAFT_67302 [Aureococcus anophagefferens]EGB04322.1 hypothetical protein AURANDRAFT_67302 [Aureococcus anophagefferens]|eukprot:XP_009041032.1 hypothetical protein AURANDRAFT_67302 [Aureococcus anophagefferens]
MHAVGVLALNDSESSDDARPCRDRPTPKSAHNDFADSVREVAARIHWFEAALKAIDIHLGDRIILALPSNFRAMTWIEAAKRSGVVYACMPAGLPCQSLADRLHDTGAKSLFVRGSEGLAIARQAISRFFDAETMNYDLQSLTPLEGNFPLFIIYTSGSTGKPKGALTSQITSVVTCANPVSPYVARFAVILERYSVTILKAGVAFLKYLMSQKLGPSELTKFDMSMLKIPQCASFLGFHLKSGSQPILNERVRTDLAATTERRGKLSSLRHGPTWLGQCGESLEL